MAERTRQRLEDVLDAISQLELLVVGKKHSDLEIDRFFRAAYERFVEIVSEASRHVPDEMRSKLTDIPWSRIAGIGNHLRHAYHRIDTGILWALMENGDLNRLKIAVLVMLKDID